MYWNRRFAILVSFVWAVLVAGGFYLLAGIAAPHRTPPPQTGCSLGTGRAPTKR